MAKHPKRPRDTNQLAHMIAQLATGELDDVKTEDGKDPAAVALGRKGGLKGGKARAEKLTAKQRSAIAKKAAQKRWSAIAPPEAEASPKKPRKKLLIGPD